MDAHLSNQPWTRTNDRVLQHNRKYNLPSQQTEIGIFDTSYHNAMSLCVQWNFLGFLWMAQRQRRESSSTQNGIKTTNNCHVQIVIAFWEEEADLRTRFFAKYQQGFQKTKKLHPIPKRALILGLNLPPNDNHESSRSDRHFGSS